MNHEQCLKAARRIRDEYLPGIIAQRDEAGTQIGHIAWMIEQMDEMSESKAMRWLGYIQGYLVTSGRATLAAMKTVSRESSHHNPGLKHAE
jgi:hypothetical protein